MLRPLALLPLLALSAIAQPQGTVTDKETPAKYIARSEPDLKCNGLSNLNWLGRGTLADTIDEFCKTLDQVKRPWYERRYNPTPEDDVIIGVDWKSADKPDQDACTSNLYQIMDSCDADEENNPLNWKHGGVLKTSGVKYDISPYAYRYIPGKCSMHVKQTDDWYGFDGPGTSRSHDFSVEISPKDGEGKPLLVDDEKPHKCGDGNPYKLDAYHATMEVTPEGAGDYIRFTMGGQSWTSKDSDGRTRCNEDGWDQNRQAPSVRHLDCFFDC